MPQAAKKLMNAHDFTTEIKVQLLEKMHEVLPGDLTGMQLYDSGTTAVEAAPANVPRRDRKPRVPQLLRAISTASRATRSAWRG